MEDVSDMQVRVQMLQVLTNQETVNHARNLKHVGDDLQADRSSLRRCCPTSRIVDSDACVAVEVAVACMAAGSLISDCRERGRRLGGSVSSVVVQVVLVHKCTGERLCADHDKDTEDNGKWPIGVLCKLRKVIHAIWHHMDDRKRQHHAGSQGAQDQRCRVRGVAEALRVNARQESIFSLSHVMSCNAATAVPRTRSGHPP